MANQDQKEASLQDDSNLKKRKYPFGSINTYSAKFPRVLDEYYLSTYEKTQGAGHLLGSEYQYTMCAIFALKFCMNDRINDFEITSNNNKYKIFDDVAINVKLHDQTELTFLFQLKHGEPKKNLTIADFVRQALKNKSYLKNPFCLKKHVEFIRTIKDDNVICILYTNNSTNLTNNLVLNLETEKVTVLKFDSFDYMDLLINTNKTSIEIFLMKIEGLPNSQFYLFSDQDNVYDTKTTIEKILKTELRCDIYHSFNDLMKTWWSSNFTLTKGDVIATLTELSLSPFMKHLSGEKHNKQSKQLVKCIMNFEITLVETSEENIVTKIWEDVELLRKMSSVTSEFELLQFQLNYTSQMNTFCLVAMKYGLTTHRFSGALKLPFSDVYKILTTLSESEICKLLWYLDLVPLVVRIDHESKEQVDCVVQLRRNQVEKKRLLLLGKPTERYSNCSTFQNLCDLRNSEFFIYIVNEFWVSLQERQKIPLKTIVDYDEAVSTVIATRELLEMTQRTLVIGRKVEEVSDFYIPRNLSTVIFNKKKYWKCEDVKDLKYLDNVLNFVCAPVGMGKSSLFIFLSLNCPPEFWSVLINLRDHNSFLMREPNYEEVLLHFLDIKSESDSFLKKIKNWFLKIKKIYFFFDGLDEIEPKCEELILSFIKQLSLDGVHVWISSRDHLEEKVRGVLNITPLKIQEFDEKEQKLYCSKRLENYSSERAEKIMNVFFRSIDISNSRYLAENPLFLRILTESFYENIFPENVFSLAKMYELILDGVISFFNEKYSMRHVGRYLKLFFLTHYQAFASKNYLGEQIYNKVDTLRNFLEELEANGDHLGLIKNVDSPVFLHKQFGEYFACLWFSRNLDLVSLLQENYFKDTDLKFMLDVILAQENPLFLAIIYRSLSTIKKIEFCFDQGGRSVLHIACSYGVRFPYYEHIRLCREDMLYVEFIEKILDKQRIFETDVLFKLNSLDYSILSGCLYPVERILEKFGDSVNVGRLFERYDSKTVAYYSAQMGYHNLFKIVMTRYFQNIELDKLLEIAILGAKDENYRIPRSGNSRVVEILLQHVETAVTENVINLALKHRCYDIIELLASKIGNNGNTILHLAAKLTNEMLDISKKKSINVESYDRHGKNILHIASEHGYTRIVKMLLEEGFSINSTSKENKTAIDYAADSRSSEIINFLLRTKNRNINDLEPTALQLAESSKLGGSEEMDASEDNSFDCKKETKLADNPEPSLAIASPIWISEKMEICEPSPNLQNFKRRPGTVNSGLYYEQLMTAYFVLNFVTDNSVTEFQISTNVVDFGSFDDIVIQLRKGKNEIVYALQIKYTEKPKSVKTTDFSRKRGTFDLIKYFDSFRQLNKMDNVYKCILFTNQKSDLRVKDGLTWNHGNLVITALECSMESVLNTSTKGLCYCFEIEPKNPETEEYRNFFSKLHLYTNQASVEQIEKMILHQLQQIFHANQSNFIQFLSFIVSWNKRERKIEKLNKRWMQRIIALNILAPFIKPLSFGDDVSYKMELLRDAISSFSLTVFEETIYDGVRQMWGNAKTDLIDINEVNRIRTKYQLAPDNIDDVENISDEFCSKLLWLMDKCPLVVTSSVAVYKILEFCPNEKFILLGKLPESLPHSVVFQNLSDLKDFKVYKDIVETFGISIQGKEEIKLEYFIKENEIFPDVSATDLVKMMTESCQIGERNEPLPEPYIPRFLSRNIINFKYIHEINENSSVILSGPRKTNLRLNVDSSSIACLEKHISSDEFLQLCQKRPTNNVHYFKVENDGKLEWIQSKGDITDLDPYRINGNFVPESYLYSMELNNKINIVIGEPGMGKSSLLRSFKNNSSSRLWTVLLDASDFTSLQKYETVEDYILKEKYKDHTDFERNILRTLMKKSCVICFWDGLDEISRESREHIIDFIKSLSKMNIIQWVTSRTDLKKYLEQTFNVLCRTIRPFNKKEQNLYIQKRHHLRSEEVTDKMMSALKLLERDDLLATPIEIFILSEVLEKNLDISKDGFSLVDLYNLFVKKKIDIYYKQKAKVDFQNELLQPVIDHHTKSILESYEKASLKSLFPDEALNITNDDHLRTIQENGDKFGFIREIRKEIPLFVHVTYAEYFAASYLQKNFHSVNHLVDILFGEKHRNVRFFFDLMLAKNSIPHLAVLQKNCSLIKKYENDLSQCKDLGNRSVLHVAVSWGKRYPSRTVHYGTETIIDNENELSVEAEDPKYMQILEYLLQKCSTSECDTLFKMTPLSYAQKSSSLFGQIKILENEKKISMVSNDDDIPNILYYSAKLGYHNVFSLFEDVPFIITSKEKNSLLHVSVIYKDFVEELLKLIPYKNKLNYRNGYGQTALHLACQFGQLEVVRLLLSHECEVNIQAEDGATPLHSACKEGHYECVRMLTNHAADINICASNGQSPLHLVCQQGHFQCAKLLIDLDVKQIDTIDIHGQTPLHYACLKGYEEIVSLLVTRGANISAVDEQGITPLQVASQGEVNKVVELLHGLNLPKK